MAEHDLFELGGWLHVVTDETHYQYMFTKQDNFGTRDASTMQPGVRGGGSEGGRGRERKKKDL